MRLGTTATAWDEQRTMPRRWGTSLDERDSGCRRLPTDDGNIPTARVKQDRRMNEKGMTLGRQRARRLVAQGIVHAKRTGSRQKLDDPGQGACGSKVAWWHAKRVEDNQ